MIGQLGLHPILVTVASGVIDARLIADAYTSRLIVNGEGGASDDIDQILSEKQPGSLMVIQGIVGQILTIKNLAKGGGDEDVRTPGGTDFTVNGEENVTVIYDAVNNEWAFMDGAIAGQIDQWSTFPAVTNVDIAGFNVFNIGNLLFDDIVGGVGSGTNPTIYYDLGNTELVIQTNATEQIVLRAGTAGGGLFARMDEAVIDFSLSPGSEFRTQALRVFNISQFDGEMVLDVPFPAGVGNPNFKINAVITDVNGGGDLGTATLPWNNLNVEQIRLRAGTVIIDIPSITRIGNDMVLNVDTNNVFRFQERNVDKLILDFLNNELKFSGIAIDMTGNNIDDIGVATVDNLLFNDTVGGVGSATNPTIYYDLGNTELVIQGNTGEEIVLRIGTAAGGLFARMDENLIDFSLSSGSEFRVQALRVFNISQFDGDMVLDVPNPTVTGNPVFKINAVVTDPSVGGDLGTFSLPWNNLNVEQIRLRDGTVIIDIPSITRQSNNMILNVNTAQLFSFRVLNAIKVEILTNKMDLNTNYLQFDAIANPGASPATERFLFADSSNSDHLSIRTPTTTIDIEAAAGGSTFADNEFEIFDDITPSKKLTFSLATATGTNLFAIFGTTDTYTFPDGGGTVIMSQGNQSIGGVKTFTTNTIFNNNVTLGDAVSDLVLGSARVAKDWDPSTDGTRDLGKSTLRWKDAFMEDLDTKSTFKHGNSEAAGVKASFWGGALTTHRTVSRVSVGEALSLTQAKVQSLQDALNAYNFVST